MAWYAAKSSGGQGLVICEATGRNIAVAYDEADAPLIAAAPALLAALKALHSCHRAFSNSDSWGLLDDEARAAAEFAISEAGEQI